MPRMGHVSSLDALTTRLSTYLVAAPSLAAPSQVHTSFDSCLGLYFFLSKVLLGPGCQY